MVWFGYIVIVASTIVLFLLEYFALSAMVAVVGSMICICAYARHERKDWNSKEKTPIKDMYFEQENDSSLQQRMNPKHKEYKKIEPENNHGNPYKITIGVYDDGKIYKKRCATQPTATFEELKNKKIRLTKPRGKDEYGHKIIDNVEMCEAGDDGIITVEIGTNEDRAALMDVTCTGLLIGYISGKTAVALCKHLENTKTSSLNCKIAKISRDDDDKPTVYIKLT